MSAAAPGGAAAGLGRPLFRLASAAAAVGALSLLLGVALGRAGVALAALDAAFLFFAGLAAGSVALAAAVRIAHGRWADAVLPIAEAGVGFFLPALGLLALLLAGSRAFIPWASAAGPVRLAALALRLLVPGAVLFWLGRRFVLRARRRAPEGEVQAAAVAYVLAYAVGLSFWAYDLVMGLTPAPPATVIPAYYFVGSFLSGFAWVALVAAIRDVSGPDLRHDIGKLLFGFIVVWSYLLWSLYLATWYANIPEESEPLLLRWHGPWKPVTQAVLLAVFVSPFWLLFSERLKRRRGTLAFGAAAVLLGLWAERVLLVVPSLHLPGGAGSLALGAGVTAGVAGLYLLAVGPGLAALRAGSAPASAGPEPARPPPPR
jgi:hypothetical protein